jgi:hypothetical protein
MLRKVVNVCDMIVRPIGDLMRDPEAKRLASLPKLPRTDAAVAMAFALRNDGSLTSSTQAIVKSAVQLYRDNLARRLIFFGSGMVNGITEADAMDRAAEKMKITSEFRSKVQDPDFPGGLKANDLLLLGEEFKRLKIKSSYLVAHPLHLWRARLLCEKMIEKNSLDVTIYPVEAERIYDRESNQVRCRAESFFIPWNILAFTEHFIKGKI